MSSECFIDQKILNEVFEKLNKEKKEAKQVRRKKILKTIGICVGIAAIDPHLVWENCTYMLIAAHA